MREETADQVDAVLSYGLEVHEKMRRGEPLDLEQVHGRLRGLLGCEAHPPGQADPSSDAPQGAGRFLGLYYPLACVLDELILMDSPWSAAWEDRKLETARFRLNERGWKFWEQAALADAGAGSDAVEVFLLCVALGFRGEWRGDRARVAAWMRTAEARIVRRTPRPNPALPPARSLGPLPPLRGSRSWLWRLLGQGHGGSAFPDIDAAWEEACRGLRRAGIDLSAAPLFLIVGDTAAGVASLIDAAFPGDPWRLRARDGGDRPDAPIRVVATADAVYVFCPGAGALPRLARRLRKPDAGRPAGDDRGPSGPARDLATIGVSPHALNGEAASYAPDLARGREAGEEADDDSRLRRVCQLLCRDRGGNAPTNGVLVLLPYAAAATDERTRQAALACRRDLEVIRAETRVRCPVLALIGDLEQAPGFLDFVERFPPGRRHGRLGTSLAGAGDATGRIAEGVEYLCGTLIPGHVRQLSGPPADEKGLDDLVPGNRRLIMLACQLRARRHRLTALFSSAVPADDGSREQSSFGGLYVAGTGGGPRERAFVAGVFEKLYDGRDDVEWTDEAIEEDRKYLSWGRYALTALGALGLIAGAALWLG